MRAIRIYSLLFLLLALITIAGQVAAQLQISVGANKARKPSVFIHEPNVNKNIKEIGCQLPERRIASSLERFADFQVLSLDNAPSKQPRKQGFLSQREQRIYQTISADFVYTSSISVRKDICTISWAVISVASRKPVIRQSWEGDPAEMIKAYYAIADEMTCRITNRCSVHAQEIAYIHRYKDDTSPTKGRWDIIRAWPNGEEIEVLHSSAYPIFSPTWSPDGTKLAFVAISPKYSQRVYVLDTKDQSIYSPVATLSPTSSPAWSPFGDQILLSVALDGGRNIFIQPLRSNQEMVRLTHRQSIDTEPSWALDGRTVAYSSDRYGPPTIFTFDFLTGTQTRINRDGQRGTQPKFIDYSELGTDQLALMYVSGSREGTSLKLVGIPSMSEITSVAYPKIEEYALSPKGEIAVIVAIDNSTPGKAMIAYDLRSGHIASIDTKDRIVTGLAWRKF